VLQVAEMGFETYSILWKALVEAGSACLLASGGIWDPHSAACQRVKQISMESARMRVALAISHPTHLTTYHQAMGQVGFSAVIPHARLGSDETRGRLDFAARSSALTLWTSTDWYLT